MIKIAVISIVSFSVLVFAYMMLTRKEKKLPMTEEDRASEARKGAEEIFRRHLYQMRDEISSFGTGKYTHEDIQARFSLRSEEEREYTNRIHKEFGIVLKTDQSILGNIMSINIDEIVFEWIACPKDGKLGACFTS